MYYGKAVKYADAGDGAVYRFGDGDVLLGEFSVSRATGEVSLLRPLPNDPGGAVFERVAYKVIRAWRDGALPEMVVWAS